MPKSTLPVRNVVASAPAGWRAIHPCLIPAAHALVNGQAGASATAHLAVEAAHRAGYRSHDDVRKTRFVGSGVTKFQTHLFAVNESPSWRFPDAILLVGWLIECGGPQMARGPARADFEANGVELMIGGTRWRYNNRRYGHGGEGLPRSHEYQAGVWVQLTGIPGSER